MRAFAIALILNARYVDKKLTLYTLFINVNYLTSIIYILYINDSLRRRLYASRRQLSCVSAHL